MFYLHRPRSDSSDGKPHDLDNPSPSHHDDFQVRDTDFAETFLFRMTISIPWRQLPADECHTLSIPSMASADSLSRQRSGVNLPEQLPPELFDGVLFYLDETRSALAGLQVQPPYLRTLRRCQQGDRKEDGLLEGLRAGSLVCRYWANSCRRSKFSRSLLCIESSDDADIFLKYAREGCSSLDPLYRIIGGLTVRQGYNTANSFVHRLHCITQLNREHKGFGIRLHELMLYGPIPEGFPCHNIATPHWSVPLAVITPSSLLAYETIGVSNIHFPSFEYVMKYVTHLIRATEEVNAEKLTWDESTVTPVSIPRLAKKNPLIRPGFFEITARGCTDNLRLCLYTALARPDCPLHWLPDVGRILRAIMSLCELCPAGDQSTQNRWLYWDSKSSNVSKYTKLSIVLGLYDNADSESNSKDLEDTRPDFHFIFAIQPLDRAPPALLHLVGWHIVISESNIPPDLINKLVLLTEYSAAPLVSVEITFENYEALKAWVWAHPSINASPPNIPIVYILICCRTNTNNVFLHIPLADEEGDCLQIDTTTLEPIGTSQFSLLF
ncbi:hypothetical protein BC629DRAFT_1519796 [Irpex lacteus]|nr:hypothetical protein BC629DRAFT_1519796 [Irpex lacteus]